MKRADRGGDVVVGADRDSRRADRHRPVAKRIQIVISDNPQNLLLRRHRKASLD